MREWCLKYIFKKFIHISQPWNDFGSLAHAVAEKYNGGGKKEINELLRKVNVKKDGTKKWIVHPEYRHKMPLAYNNLIKFYDEHLKDAKKVYRELELRKDVTKYIDVLALIDVLYQNKMGEWCIADYKTSKKKVDGLKQLSYYYALLKIARGKVPKKMKGQIIYLALDDGNNNVSEFVENYELGDYELNYAYNRIQAGIDKIVANGLEKDNWIKKPSALCPYCVFKEYGLCDGKGTVNGKF